MSITKTFSLEDVIAAMRTLPDQSQQDLASEIMERVDDISNSRLTDEQREIIKERISQPREHVSRDDVHAMLRKFNPAL
ncbi:MAG: hypothetical protein GY927_18905 [bacterium]|nr:hypothetical protein [bacterium]